MPLNSPATDISSFLQAQGVGTEGTDLFIGLEPDEPDFVISIFDIPGFPPNPKYLRDEPSIQVRVRGNKNNYDTAWQKMQEIKDVMLGAQPQLLNGTDYVLFVLATDPMSLGRDESSRPLIISNWNLVREMQSGGNRVAL